MDSAKGIYAFRRGQENLLMFKPASEWVIEGLQASLSGTTRRAGLSISEPAELLVFL